jgi:hypothetical protein
MEFDEDDIAWLQEDKIWMDVIKHEMGHVLGIGTLVRRSQTEGLADVVSPIAPSVLID